MRTNKLFKGILSKTNDCIVLDESQMIHLRAVYIDMLNDIAEICKKEDIGYALSGGSLLGAIRHKGFIPWDDDVDIDIPRKDYKKFMSAFQKKYSDKYSYQIPGETHDYGTLITRIRKNGTVYRNQGEEEVKECGVYIDIVIVENTFDNIFLRKLQEIICTVALGMTSCRNFFKNRKSFIDLAKDHKEILAIFKLKVFLGALIAWMPVHTVAKIADRAFSLCKNNQSEYITIPGGIKKFSGELFLRKDYCEYIQADFEGRKYNIPRGYDVILKRLYGDYMEIPSPENREKHVVLELML